MLFDDWDFFNQNGANLYAYSFCCFVYLKAFLKIWQRRIAQNQGGILFKTHKDPITALLVVLTKRLYNAVYQSFIIFVNN